MNDLTIQDLYFYKDYWERYYSHRKYNLNILDVVYIHENIEIDKGYAGEHGIVCGLSVDHRVQVIAYNNENNQFSVGTFCDNYDLTKSKKWKMQEFPIMLDYLKSYLLKNIFNLCDDHFRDAWNKHKEQAKKSNIIFVDFSKGGKK